VQCTAAATVVVAVTVAEAARPTEVTAERHTVAHLQYSSDSVAVVHSDRYLHRNITAALCWLARQHQQAAVVAAATAFQKAKQRQQLL
jgi:mRNA-degrading endonuclease toxin of MazEF toxin-antitoxin module